MHRLSPRFHDLSLSLSLVDLHDRRTHDSRLISGSAGPDQIAPIYSCNNASPTNRAISHFVYRYLSSSDLSFLETRTSNRYGNIYNGQRSMFALTKEFLAMSCPNRSNLNVPVEKDSVRGTCELFNNSTPLTASSSVTIFRYMVHVTQTFRFTTNILIPKCILLKFYLSTSYNYVQHAI